CLQRAGCERCHLGHQRRSKGEDTQQEKYYVHFFIDVFHSCNVPKKHSGSSCGAVDTSTPAWPNFRECCETSKILKQREEEKSAN
ncbi:Ribosomal RNA small subunit methyltransferase J, partial [Frankliniella fusca]